MISIVVGIAFNSWKQFVRDRIFYLVLIVALVMVGFSYLLATLTIVESRKILLDFGFSAISLAGGMTAVFLGVVAVAREIEQKTVYSVLSKPISRSAYLLGKFLGCLLVLALVQVLFALTVRGTLWMIDESAPPGFVDCVFLILLENTILLACAFLFSAFASSVLAAGLTVAFFLIGRSNDSFHSMSERGLTPGARAFAKALYLIAPNLERFNLRDVVAYGRPFPPEMPWIGLAYCAAYVLVCLAASCIVINSRDLP